MKPSSLCWAPFLDGELTRIYLLIPFSHSCLPVSLALLPQRGPMCTALGGGGCLTFLNLLQGNVLSRAARWAKSSAGSFLLFWSNLRLSSIALPTALPLCREMSSWDPIRPLHPKPWPNPSAITLTHPGRARGRGPQLASGLAWKRLSPRWRELGLASSRMVKLACSLEKGVVQLRGGRHSDMHKKLPTGPAYLGDLGRHLPGSGFSHSFNKHLLLPMVCVPDICRW